MKVSRGFSLIELMIALVLGLLVVAASIQVLVTTMTTFKGMQDAAERQEILRFVSDAVSRDIRVAPVVYGLSSGGQLDELYLRFEPSYNAHPYCPGERLHLLRYFLNAEGEELKVEYWCSALVEDNVGLVRDPSTGFIDMSGLESPSDSGVLQSGISSVSFSRSGLVYDHLDATALSSTIPFQVETRIVLSDSVASGLSEERKTFVFNTFRREELLKRLSIVIPSADEGME